VTQIRESVPIARFVVWATLVFRAINPVRRGFELRSGRYELHTSTDCCWWPTRTSA